MPPVLRPILLILCVGGQFLAADARAADTALSKAAHRAQSQSRAPAIDRGSFLRRPAIAGVHMSPDGRYLSFLKRNEGGVDLWVQDIADGSQRRLLIDVRAADLRWSGDGSRLWVADEQGLAVIDPATHRARRILKWDVSRRQRLFGVDAHAPAYALVSERVEQDRHLRYRYLLVDGSGATRQLHDAALPLHKVLLNSDGSLAFAAAFDGSDYDTVIRRYTSQGMTELTRCRGIEVCDLVGYEGQGDVLWMLAQRGEDNLALQRWQAGPGQWKRMHRDPADIADAEEVLLNETQSDWRAIAYYGARRHWYGNGEEMKSRLTALQRHFPDANLRLTQATADRVWLVQTEQSNGPLVRHFLYEPGRDRLQPLFAKEDAESQAPSPDQLTPAHPVSWRAGDGMLLHGYVYLPLGTPLGKAPLIAWLHGGPFTRLYDDYDPRIQLLANRGYAVFLPNFRASTGYGHRYQSAANGDVGKGRVLSDIIDGLDFLLANGIGDPNRQAVAGHSFGGYASLLAVTHLPQRFLFAFAGAAPTDYGWAKQWQANNESDSLRGDGPPVALSFAQHGLPFADASWRQKMQRESPLASLSELRAPIYLWGGARDDRTPIKSIAHYAGEAKRNGKAVALLIDSDAGHTPVEALGDEAWVFLLESAAQRHFGGGVTPASAELSAFVRKYLLMDTRGVFD